MGGSITAFLIGETSDSPAGEQELGKGPTFTRKFKVYCDSIADGPTVAAFAPGLPNVGDFYNYGNDGTAFFTWCVKKRPTPLGIAAPANGGRYYLVECDYDTPINQLQEGQVNDPLLELPEKRTSGTTTEKPMIGWWYPNGFLNPFLNSAGERIEKPPTKKVPVRTMTIARNYDVEFDDAELSLTYLGKVNSDFFWGWEPGTVLCTGIESEIRSQTLADGVTEFAYNRITFQFEFSGEETTDGDVGFKAQLLDCGTYYLDSGDRKAFLTKEGHKFVGLLDGSGGALNGDGSPDPIAPKYLDPVDKYNSVAFGDLGLPQDNSQVKTTKRIIS